MISKLDLLRRGCRASAIVVAALAYACSDPGGSDRGASHDELSRISDVMQQVENDYVHPVTDDQLTTNALKGMLSRLDPHSGYLDAREYREMKADSEGRFGGLGIELTRENSLPKVIAAIDDTPAARAGIEPGDLITRIDGRATDGMDPMSIVETLRGKPGTQVTITVARNGRGRFDVTLTRAVIHVASVKSSLEPDAIGYARVTSFTERTQAELVRAIAGLKQKAGDRLNGFVLDLRDDPGGLVEAAVDVAGDFLDGGTVVSTRGRHAGDDHVYTARTKGDLIPGTPMVVLINSASASASEIVAGALQDRHRATVMGTPSFGKGSVQTVIPVSGGAIRLTTALYYTPSGRSIQGTGIDPDIIVDVPADEQISQTVVTREADLHGAFKNGGSAKPGVAPTAPPESAAEQSRPIRLSLIGTNKDAQLMAALKTLEDGKGHSGSPR